MTMLITKEQTMNIKIIQSKNLMINKTKMEQDMICLNSQHQSWVGMEHYWQWIRKAMCLPSKAKDHLSIKRKEYQ